MPLAGILSLPLELSDEIIAYVAISVPELLTLRCVNKALCSLTTPAAFREIAVRITEKSTQGFLELLVRTDIAKHVRAIEIIEDPDSYEDENKDSEEERFKRVRDHFRGAFSMLHPIPSLESLVITFTPGEDGWLRPFTSQQKSWRYRLLQFDVSEGLACNPNPLPALQSLHINAWFPFYDYLYSHTPFEQIVAPLRDLHFNVQDTDYKIDSEDATAHDFWTFVVGPRILRPAVNLTSLTMGSSVGFGSLIRLDLGSITFLCLTSLSLTNFVWDDTRLDPGEDTLEAEDFIVRHGKTLKKLKLQSCTISIPDDRSTPVRSWTVVWNRFADELTKLVELDVEYSFNLRYVHYLPEYGFSSRSTFTVPGTEQDVPVLEALATMVRRRRNGSISCDGG